MVSFYSHLPAYEESVLKRQHLNSRRRIIAQKKAYNVGSYVYQRLISTEKG